MAQGQYCIVDNTIDANLAMEAHKGLTLEEAQAWISANQVELETPLVVGEITYTTKFQAQPDSCPVVVE